MTWGDLSWTCHVCGAERPDPQIGVLRKPLRGPHGDLSRTLSENIRYCLDNPSCVEGSKTYSHVRNWGN